MSQPSVSQPSETGAAAPFLTVAVCTWNRADLLRGTLESLAALEVPEGLGWEVVLVDNNSTDHTPEVAAAYAGRLPLRYVREARQGICWARNRAVREARGEVVLWTDDDVRVPTHWLGEYARVVCEHPDAGFFGGPIRPAYEVPPPAWVAESLHVIGPTFALRDLGGEVFRLPPNEIPFGANYAIRRALLPEDPFDVRLGRVGAELLSGEETVLMSRLVAQGHHGIWVGTAPVQHFTPSTRLTRRYVWRFFEGLGRSEARATAHEPIATLLGMPRWAIRRLAETSAALGVGLVRGRAAWVPPYVEAARLVGLIREWRRAREALA